MELRIVCKNLVRLRRLEGSVGVNSQRTQRNLLGTLEYSELADGVRALERAAADREEMGEALAVLGGAR